MTINKNHGQLSSTLNLRNPNLKYLFNEYYTEPIRLYSQRKNSQSKTKF